MRYLFGFAGLIFAFAYRPYRQAIADTLTISEWWALLVAFGVGFLPFALLRKVGASDREIDQEGSTGFWDWKRELGLYDSIRVEYFIGAFAIAVFQLYLLWKTFRHA